MSPYIVITGAHGFIGINLLEKILSASLSELGFAENSSPNFANFDKISHNKIVSVIASDLPESLSRTNARRFAGSARVKYVDYTELFSVLAQLKQPPELIFHNGACSSTVEQDPAVFAKLNLNYSKQIWEYCSKNNVPLVYASSAAVYGDGALGFSDQKEDCQKYRALNLYGKSKLDFDLWTLTQKNTPPTWFGLRYFNVYGQFEAHKGGQASMVYHGYQQATRLGKIKLFKTNTSLYQDGEQLRDFIYVNDIVAISIILMRLCLTQKYSGEKLQLPDNGLFLNIGTGEAKSWNSLAQNVFANLNIPNVIEYIPIPSNICAQYQNYTCANLTSFRSINEQTQCYQFYNLAQGISQYIQKHLLRGE